MPRTKIGSKHGKHVWGVGPTYDALACIGAMALGLAPKNSRTLDKAFSSGHPVSEGGSFKLIRPSSLVYEICQQVAANPERYAKTLRKMGLERHLIEA